MAFASQNCDKNLSKVEFWQFFVTFSNPECFTNVSKAEKKCVKNVSKAWFVTFLLHFISWCFLSIYLFLNQNVLKMQQIRKIWYFFVTFLNRVLTEFKYILYFDIFLIHFWRFLDTFLSHLGFSLIFDSLLAVLCEIDDFWHIFVSCLCNFDTFLSHFWNHGTYIE